jgi:hypothetical protein
LFGFEFRNTNTNTVYVHIYDATSATPGTTVPIDTVAVPGGSATAPGIARRELTIPITFGTGIRIANDDNENATDATGTVTNGITGQVYYK